MENFLLFERTIQARHVIPLASFVIQYPQIGECTLFLTWIHVTQHRSSQWMWWDTDLLELRLFNVWISFP